jgi:hypothetical protein
MRGLREGLPGVQTEPKAKRQARLWLAQTSDPEAEPRKPRKESRTEMMTAFWLIVGVIALIACFLGWYQERMRK